MGFLDYFTEKNETVRTPRDQQYIAEGKKRQAVNKTKRLVTDMDLQIKGITSKAIDAQNQGNEALYKKHKVQLQKAVNFKKVVSDKITEMEFIGVNHEMGMIFKEFITTMNDCSAGNALETNTDYESEIAVFNENKLISDGMINNIDRVIQSSFDDTISDTDEIFDPEVEKLLAEQAASNQTPAGNNLISNTATIDARINNGLELLKKAKEQ